VEGISAPLVSFSALEAGRLAGRAMLEKAHMRAAFFAFQRAGLGSQYERGLREALVNGGGELRAEFVCYDDSLKVTAAHEIFLKENLERVLANKNRPTAIFCPFDSEAESVYLILSQLGIKVPEEISLISFGGTWREGALMRRLAAVTVDEEELGRNAVHLLNEMRRNEKPLTNSIEIVMPLNWSNGATLGPPPVRQNVAA
jgi:DNA-binding LacI/PurR family transcriptional regulator